MKFPVSVIVVGDQIVLIQAQITDEFTKSLRDFERTNPYQSCYIRSISEPQLGDNIYLNGDIPENNYKIVKTRYTKQIYDLYVNAINTYKTGMGYE